MNKKEILVMILSMLFATGLYASIFFFTSFLELPLRERLIIWFPYLVGVDRLTKKFFHFIDKRLNK